MQSKSECAECVMLMPTKQTTKKRGELITVCNTASERSHKNSLSND